MNENEFNNSTGLDDAKLSQLLQRSDRWIATLAHELRNPLGAIMMSLEELNSCCAADAAARLTREIAMNSARHMAGVIDDTLDLCRGHREAAQLRTEPVDLVKIVSAAIRNSQPVIAHKRHQVTLEASSVEVILPAHPTRLEQIVTNLLANSANYTRPGGQIAVKIETMPNCVELRIRDNGVGISPDCITKIFEPYWRGSTSNGLGIGLAVVKSMVELHRGTITAHSAGSGKGAEFIIRLPSSAQYPGQPDADSAVAGGGCFEPAVLPQ